MGKLLPVRPNTPTRAVGLGNSLIASSSVLLTESRSTAHLNSQDLQPKHFSGQPKSFSCHSSSALLIHLNKLNGDNPNNNPPFTLIVFRIKLVKLLEHLLKFRDITFYMISMFFAWILSILHLIIKCLEGINNLAR